MILLGIKNWLFINREGLPLGEIYQVDWAKEIWNQAESLLEAGEAVYRVTQESDGKFQD